MEAGKKIPITIELSTEQRLQLRVLRSSPAMGGSEGNRCTLEEILSYIVASVCDGIRRPGSWERGCVASMFGEWDVEAPICRFCGYELVDEDEPLEWEMKHCETCLLEAIDEWAQHLHPNWFDVGKDWAAIHPGEPDEALKEIVWLALDVIDGSPEDRKAAQWLCWEAMGRKSPLTPLADDDEIDPLSEDDAGVLQVN